jgi:hypothetical protein
MEGAAWGWFLGDLGLPWTLHREGRKGKVEGVSTAWLRRGWNGMDWMEGKDGMDCWGFLGAGICFPLVLGWGWRRVYEPYCGDYY